jgi:RNA polymerase primary sigma factor
MDADLAAIQAINSEVESLRQEIVRANLRLVVSIAKKHVGWSPRFFEVVSDGNMSLLRAVEKFDYARGYKFSTYASWAIMKNYARTVPEEHYHVSRFVTGQDELLHTAPDRGAVEASKLDGESLSDALKAGLDLLTDRERDVVTGHFGLFGASAATTLEELGKRLGVTKERVRQIERRALDKMRSALSPALAELLPG